MPALLPLLLGSLLTLTLTGGQTMTTNLQSAVAAHPYVGLWVTADGQVRHQLLPDNRYIEARGTREAAYQGRYEVTGDHIEYWDDTGFTADGDFRGGVLYHGGMVLTRRTVKPGATP